VFALPERYELAISVSIGRVVEPEDALQQSRGRNPLSENETTMSATSSAATPSSVAAGEERTGR
jgi:hypothetical protein